MQKSACPSTPNAGLRPAATSVTLLSVGLNPVPAIVAAQAMTVIAAPVVAGSLWWLTNSRDVMGDNRNGPVTNALALVGFLLLLAIAWYVASQKVWPEISGFFERVAHGRL